MLGDKIGEVKGKRLVRRVISVDPPTAEVTFEDGGKVFGISVTGMGTYTSVVRADGSSSAMAREWRRRTTARPRV